MRYLYLILAFIAMASISAQQSNGAWFPVTGMPYLDVKGFSSTHNGPVLAGVPDQQIEALLVDWGAVPSYVMFVVGPYYPGYVQALSGVGVLHIHLYEAKLWDFWINPTFNMPGIITINLTRYMGIGALDPSLKGAKYSVQCYVVYGLNRTIDPVPDPFKPWNKGVGQRRWLTYARVVTIQ